MDSEGQLPSVEPLIARLIDGVADLLPDSAYQIVGIRTGGLELAQRICKELDQAPPGELDIGFHRDDFSRRGLNGRIGPSRLAPVEDQTVILVDDVLHSGRTIRAAINALFEYGRPRAVRLAVLIDRPGREIPIQADVYGARLELPAHQRIKLRGEHLELQS